MIDIDVTTQINAVRREVGRRALQAGEARVVTLSQPYEAPVEDVWDACTNPERIPRWFLPVSGELRLGGRYQLEGNAGGTVESCDPPHGFAATWEFDDNVSGIALRLGPAELAGGRAGTLLRLEHVGPDDDAHWSQFGPGAVGVGWDLTLMGLALHLSSPARAVDPEESAAWLSSDDGVRFVALSSELWCDANVAAGEDQATAQAMADRTTVAYTAPPES
ncbi:SRPBCC family protein [Streptomyces sp. 4N509B]|uniref:SRPBCC family protein n=1 Tax=Streptomyces sp. 4N509B TaxID=3457413 RepID=UPI003FCF3AD5